MRGRSAQPALEKQKNVADTESGAATGVKARTLPSRVAGVQRVTTAKLIYHELQQQIIRMELLPGTPLNEKALTEKYGVSRTPVREALIRLAKIVWSMFSRNRVHSWRAFRLMLSRKLLSYDRRWREKRQKGLPPIQPQPLSRSWTS
ncbi:transcriptional regulator [Brucella sp. NVSL 07-0026]|nr:transcriptional regulator [Brucella sp. NVSL 07-0026]